MKTKYFLLVISVFSLVLGFAQTDTISLKQIVVYGTQVPVTLQKSPSAVSFVDSLQLSVLPKATGADEALRLVPGVLVDNQHNSEKMHISIRGQGILTERGLRGINVVLDGIPLSDPSGFVPDLYDIEWRLVKNIEVYRGSMSSIYGSAASGGLINITTATGSDKNFDVRQENTVGSYYFVKNLSGIYGSGDNLDYSLSYSHVQSKGYRIHQGYIGDIFYEKLQYRPSKSVMISQILAHTGYFQQNPEGLNLSQFDDLRQANPDAVPFNEYQKVRRTTAGLITDININRWSSVSLTGYLRPWFYKETSNKAAEYRYINNYGSIFKYNARFGKTVKHNLILGLDYKYQDVKQLRLPSIMMYRHIDRLDDYNLEGDSLLTNNFIKQQSINPYLVYSLTWQKLTLLLSSGYYYLSDLLDNKLLDPSIALDTIAFEFFSYRAGISYSLSDKITVYTDAANGFIMPSVEELANNPFSYSGFNTNLKPATSQTYELGIRGKFSGQLAFDITGFVMQTRDDFFRFKLSDRGNQEVFYGNAGNSLRKGIEIYLFYSPVDILTFEMAYTFSDFRYVSVNADPIYNDTTLLTKPPRPGQYLPNSPRHVLYAQAGFSPARNLWLYVSDSYRSAWAIYTNADIYDGLWDPAIYQPWYEGYNLVNASAVYRCKLKKATLELLLGADNLLNTPYIAFTEPDPDGNSYHPGPGRQVYFSVRLGF